MARSPRRLSNFAALVLSLFITPVAFAGLDPVNKDEDGVALRGYDVVAYFTSDRPVRGDESFSVEWMGASWLFDSAANMELFEKNPQKYAPQYGGYCAWAVGHNYTADGDPHAWSIVDDRLYLNYNKAVREMWMKDQKVLIRKGDKNWPELLRK